MDTGIIEVYLKNSKKKEFLADKEKFVALNSFLKIPIDKRKSKVRLGNEIYRTKDINKIEWIPEGVD